MAIEMTEEMVEHVDSGLANRKVCILATAGKDGWPSMGFRGSMMVYDKDHLAFWERSRKDGLQHIEENPQVLVMYRDPEARIAWKFYGRATVHTSGDVLEKVWDRTVQAEKDSDPEKKGCAVVIDVEKITSYPGQVLQEK
ncbi:MAG: pyridoxamine 5'-phosphate oxidase family protein [Chloroflexi bacterium]|nr:pyridoxamine 5'-phosphate oxidase family protein [Chloroflexota bacterium]